MFGRALLACVLLFAGRHAFAAEPFPLVNIKDYGGYADALKGAAQYAASGVNVALAAVQYIDVSVTSAGGSSATLTPTWPLPNIAAFQPNTYAVSIPGVGVGGATVTGTITALDASTGTITCSRCAFAAQTGTAAVMEIHQTSYPGTSGLNGSFYGPVTISNATDAISGSVYGSTIVLSQEMIPNSSTQNDGNTICVNTPGRTEWCGVIVDDHAADGKTVVAVGVGSSPPSIPYTQAGANAKVTWGRFLFRNDDATACSGSARKIQVPQAGAGTTSGGQTNPFEGTIATRYDPLSVTLTSSVRTTVGTTIRGAGVGIEGELLTGCDDWPAYQKAVNATYHNPFTIENPVTLYLPHDSFMATAYLGRIHPTNLMLQCGEGTVYWPDVGQPFYHGATSCSRNHAIRSFPDVKDVTPAIHLKHLSALTPGSTATLVIVGNSPAQPGDNGANFISGRLDRICAAFQSAYPDLTWNCVDRTVGGTQMYSLDPGGITNGYPVGSVLPPWYTDASRPWLTGYVEPLNPDVIIAGFADQEELQQSIAAPLALISATQSPAWLSATGRYPDIGFMPLPWQPTGWFSQVDTNHASSFQRSFVKSCVTPLAPIGGQTRCPFLIDEARMLSILVDGDDPETTPMRLATALPVSQSFITTFPWKYQVPRTGLSFQNKLHWYNPNPTVGGMLAAAGGEIDFTVSGNVNATPQTITVREKATALAAPGQAAITIGPDAYRYAAGWHVSGQGGLPADALIESVDPSAGTVTINNDLTAQIASGAFLTFTEPGPNTGYPGGILRISKDAASGNLAYRYDTEYWQVASADCSGTAGDSYITCATAEVGNWHRFQQIAIPGAGNSQCPNPGGPANCYVATIASVSYAVTPAGIGSETVNLYSGATAATASRTTAGKVPKTFSARQPYVFRTSIPLTVSQRAAETFYANVFDLCGLHKGVAITTEFQVEYRGSRLNVSYCDDPPGQSWFVKQYIERFDSPFLFQIDSPNHMSSGTNFLMFGPGPLYAKTGPGRAATGQGSWEVDLEHPTAAPTARLVPDIYGWCRVGTAYPTGDAGFSPWGGGCVSHYGQMGGNLIDDAILSQLRLR